LMVPRRSACMKATLPVPSCLHGPQAAGSIRRVVGSPAIQRLKLTGAKRLTPRNFSAVPGGPGRLADHSAPEDARSRAGVCSGIRSRRRVFSPTVVRVFAADSEGYTKWYWAIFACLLPVQPVSAQPSPEALVSIHLYRTLAQLTLTTPLCGGPPLVGRFWKKTGRVYPKLP
jgi:hypothetical protein